MFDSAGIRSSEASSDTLHDMRNLFAATAAAAGLVEASPSPDRRAMIANSLRDAARRGQEQCDRLMGRPADSAARVPYNQPIDALIEEAVPLLRLGVGPRISILTDLRAANLRTALDEEEIEIILLELATNVRRHAIGATHMSVRTSAAGERLWLVVANDGPPAQTLCRVGGRGLARIRRMLRAADSRLYLRRSPSGGLVAGVSVPIVSPAGEGCRPCGILAKLANPSPRTTLA